MNGTSNGVLNSKARMVELLLLLVLVLVCGAYGQRAGQRAGQGGQHLDELVGGEHLVVEHRLRHGAHLAVEHVRARHLQQLPLLVRKRKHIQVRYSFTILKISYIVYYRYLKFCFVYVYRILGILSYIYRISILNRIRVCSVYIVYSYFNTITI